MPNQCLSFKDSEILWALAWVSNSGFSVSRPIIMVMTARHRLISTLFFRAILTPNLAALATAHICGKVKQVVTLVGIASEVNTFTTSTPWVLAGTFIMTLGAIERISRACFIIWSVSVRSLGSSCPEMEPYRPFEAFQIGSIIREPL